MYGLAQRIFFIFLRLWNSS